MKFEGGGLSLVLKFCLVLGSDHNHNRWKREGEGDFYDNNNNNNNNNDNNNSKNNNNNNNMVIMKIVI